MWGRGLDDHILNVLAACDLVGLLIGLSGYPRLFMVLWGVWLYIVLAASALIPEVLTLRAGGRSSQE